MNTLRAIMALILALIGNTCLGAEELLVFTADWCGPCQQFKADLKENPKLAGDLEVSVINIDKAKDMAQEFGVKTVPTFVLVEVKEGVVKKEGEVRRQVGYTGPKKFQRWLEKRQ